MLEVACLQIASNAAEGGEIAEKEDAQPLSGNPKPAECKRNSELLQVARF